MQENQKLGRGLSALLGESKVKQSQVVSGNNSFVTTVPLTKITAGVYQPRRNFNQDALRELSESIKLNGVLQPIILRKTGDEGEYEIIAGERRFRATKLAGLTEIPAIVKKLNNHEALELALVENIQRSDLALTEEAEGYQRLMNEFTYTQEQISKKVGKSRSHITNILRLLALPKGVQDSLNQNQISMGHARALVNSQNPEALLKKILEESLNVREIETIVRDEKVENIKNTPLLVRNESQIKFINSGQIDILEKELGFLIGSKAKISYNAFRQAGKIEIKFKEIAEIQDLIERLKLD